MEWLMYVSVAIIAVAFAALVFYIIQTLQSMKKTMESVSSTVDDLQKQVDGITEESTNLLHKTNALAEDLQHKSDSLNSVFEAASDLGDSFKAMNQAVRKVSVSVSKEADQQSDQMAKAIKWGNVVFDFWTKWKAKKAETEDQRDVTHNKS